MNVDKRKTGGFKSIALTVLLLSIIVLFSSCSSGSVDVKVKAEFWEAVEMSDNTRAINLAKKNPWLLKEFGNGGWTLVLASCNGNLELVKFLTENGIDVNIKSGQYVYSALHGAVNSGNIELVKYLVNNGAVVNCKDQGGWTPLHTAAWQKKEIFEYLISKGGEINIRDSSGRTPLYCACSNGNLDLVRYLISKGADTSVKDNYGKNILHPAIRSGNYELILYLESMGLKPSDPDTVIIDAIDGKKFDVVKHFVESGVKFDKKTVLSHFSFLEGDYFEIIEYLLSKGAKINSAAPYKHLILITAVQKDDLELVKLLLSKGGNLNLKDSWNTPVLLYSLGCSKNETEMVKLFISKGVSIDCIDGLGNSFVNIAVVNGNLETVKFLESNGAEPGIKGVITPLHLSSYGKNIDSMGYYIDKGFSVNIKDSEGNTPLHYGTYYESIADLNTNVSLVNFKSLPGPDVAIVKYLISKGARVNLRNNKGQQPIHFAAQISYSWNNDHFNILEYLLSKGSDVNAKDNNGNTPLHLSISKTDVVFLDKLISFGANVNSRNKNGETPLNIALKIHQPRDEPSKDKIKVLIKRGALPQLKDFKYVIQAKSWELLPILLFENKLILSGLIVSAVIIALLLFLLFRSKRRNITVPVVKNGCRKR